MPPGFGDAFFIKTNDAFVSGIVPMTTNYFAFFPGLSNPETNPFADVTGYFTCPPQEGVDGVVRQSVALGGQGASIVSYIPARKIAKMNPTDAIKGKIQ